MALSAIFIEIPDEFIEDILTYRNPDMDVESKVCIRCEKEKPIERFIKDTRHNSISSTCRDCYNLVAREKRAARGLVERPKASPFRHPRANEYNSRYRAKIRQTKVEQVNYDLIYERDKGICHICKNPVSRDELEYDHVIPLSRGGDHTYRNIKVSHKACNRRKSDRLMEELHGSFS